METLLTDSMISLFFLWFRASSGKLTSCGEFD
jgi:hypothetical protein